ncbi:hypothetical protein C1645_833791 [Glomus cerebriforme]|uniref:Uncharacterized protein n=1 Tax=Glomus cerebriforme TaxID=658196 RepID=A0A397SBX0_9GLOM|nr:hypothetical protein C1645_833791 [Glomus cerebriforme]
MTQHTPPNNQNNRNINNHPNTSSSTNLYYSTKVRGTHTRVSRVRVTTIGKPPFPEKQYRSCPRCKESTNNMKMLTARVGRIEQLVDVLAKTTRGLASMTKREDRIAQNNNMKFKGLDLTRCTLQELQKLVIATTNVMTPTNTNKPISNPPSTTSSAKDNHLTDITITTNNEKNLYSEPTVMEDVKILSNTSSSRDLPNRQQPIKTAVTSLKVTSSRQDSGYCEPDPPKAPPKPSNN